MRKHLARSLAALLLASVVCPVSSSAQLTEADVLGCYDVTEGEWTEGRVAGLMRVGDELLTDTSAVRSEPIPSALGLDSAYSQIPPRIQLAGPHADPTVLGSAWQIVVPEGALPTPHMFMSYGVDGASLRLSFSTGFHGVGARLETRGGGAWAGMANTHSDNIPYRSWSRRIDLIPVPCDSPPPVPSSVMRPVPRAVQLVGGATITLGEPLPAPLEKIPRETRAGAFTIIGRTDGLFASADSIVVLVSQEHGVIGRIRLIYASEDMHPVLTERLVEAFGSPDSFGLVPDPDRPEWRNRVTRVTLAWGNRLPRFTYVNFYDSRYRW